MTVVSNKFGALVAAALMITTPASAQQPANPPERRMDPAFRRNCELYNREHALTGRGPICENYRGLLGILPRAPLPVIQEKTYRI